jgi:hypothetical protein
MYKAYFRDLLRYSIVFRIFADKRESKEHPHIVDEIVEMAEKELKELDEKWETISS